MKIHELGQFLLGEAPGLTGRLDVHAEGGEDDVVVFASARRHAA